MYKLVFLGCGNKLHKLVNVFPKIIDYIDILIDSYKSEFLDIKVHNPEILKKVHELKIVICVYSKSMYKEIYEKIVNEYQLNSNYIITLNEFLADILSKHNDILLKPSSVILEASTICQLNCVGCYMRKSNYANLGAGYLHYNDFVTFVDNNDFIKDIELSNNGEVFLNPDLKKIIHYAAQKGVNLYINGGANFNNVNKDVMEEMAKSGIVKSITVALDGASQEIYQIYRQNGKFNSVLNNIKILNEMKKSYNTDFPKLKWQYILFEHNEEDVEKAKKIAYGHDMEMIYKLDWGKGFVPKNRDRLVNITGMKYFSREEYKKNEGVEYSIENICLGMIYSPAINYDGKLLGCCGNVFKDWNSNVFKNGLIDSLNSKEYRNTVISMLTGTTMKVNDSVPCSSCDNFEKIKQILSVKDI